MKLSSGEIKEVLNSLGYNLVDQGTYWQTNAIFRNGDNKTALLIYKDSGVWRDFVTQTPPMPFRALLEAHLGTNSPRELDKYLKPQSRGSFYTPTHNPSTPNRLEMEEIYPTEDLEKLLPHYKFYTDKGISIPLLKSLNCGLDTHGVMYQRFVFPVYNENKKIHGFAGRDMANKANRPKWKHVGKKTTWVYPLYLKEGVADAIRQQGVILVESIGDLLALMEHGYDNVLVTFGLDLSPKLICALIGLSPPLITLAQNNDQEGEVNRGLVASCKNYLKLLNHFDHERLRISLPLRNDFGDMGSTDFAEWDKKCEKLTPSYQAPRLVSYMKDFHQQKLISKQLYKNIKFIQNL